MSSLKADSKIIIAAVGIFILLAIAVAVLAPSPESPALSVRSAAPDGALALETWINQSGYRVQELTSWTQLDDVNVLFILDPLTAYTNEDALLLESWLRRGNMLIVAGDPYTLNDVLAPYNLSLSPLDNPQPAALPGSPALRVLPFSTVQVDALARVQINDPDKASSAAFHVYAGIDPVVASEDEGTGRLWVSGGLRPFTNRGLQDPGSARLIGDMLASVPHTAVVAFDEQSHGFGSAADQSVEGWLLTTPPGWGILLGLGMVLVFFALRGRRFGHAVPLPDERLRRESAEYIHAMATLFRRSGQRREIIEHYNQQLRRALSQRYGVDSHLASAELVKAAAYHDSTIDAAALRSLLNQLGRPDLSEPELVKTASELDLFLKNLA